MSHALEACNSALDSDDDEVRCRRAAIASIPPQIREFGRALKVVAEVRQMPETSWPALELTDFFAEDPGHGHGTQVLNKLLELADAAGLNVYLKPSSARNREFYGRFGFEPCRQYHGMLAHYPPLPKDEDDYPCMPRKGMAP